MTDTLRSPGTPDSEAAQKPEGPSNQKDPVAAIEEETRLKMYVEKLDAQVPAEESVCAESEIREEKVFSKKEILDLMVLFSTAKNLDLDKMTVARVIRDPKDNLLILEVKSPAAEGGYQLLNYTIMGRHAGNQSRTSCIDQTSFDSDDMPEGGDIIAEYKDGTWVFNT